MVEAAVIFPLVIASVMALIYLMINLYSFTATQSYLHVELRGESGSQSGLTEREIVGGAAFDRYRAAAERREITIENYNRVLRPYVSAQSLGEYAGNAIAGPSVERAAFGRSYLIDEAELARRAEFISDMAGG